MGRLCVVYLCVCECAVKCVHVLWLHQADGDVVQNNPEMLMKKMNPTDYSHPSGQKQGEKENSLTPEGRAPPSTTHTHTHTHTHPYPHPKSKMFSQYSAHAASLFGFTGGTAGNKRVVRQQRTSIICSLWKNTVLSSSCCLSFHTILTVWTRELSCKA